MTKRPETSGGHAPPSVDLEELIDPELLDWYRMSPDERSRTPQLLIACARAFRDHAQPIAQTREAAAAALQANESAVEKALAEEEARERTLDRQYWLPLRAELGELRRRSRDDR